MSFFSDLFGKKKKDEIDIVQLIKDGAQLIDVRTEKEFSTKNIKNAINIPLQEISENVDSIKNLDKKIIVYCRSGNRSGMAAKILNKHEIEAYNGGGIEELLTRIGQSL